MKGILPRRGARIPEARTSRCRRCGNGRNRYGNPQYPCKACEAFGVLEPKGRSPEAPKGPMGRAYGEGVCLGGRPRRGCAGSFGDQGRPEGLDVSAPGRSGPASEATGRRPIGGSGRPTADLPLRGQAVWLLSSAGIPRFVTR